MPTIAKKITAATSVFFLFILGACNQKKSLQPDVTKLPDSASTATLVTNPYQPVDKSPMDVAYLPHEYPQLKLKGEWPGGPSARVIYSRPHKKGRLIFGTDSASLCPYGKPWRLGANEATEIQFFKPVFINGKNLPAGRYTLYCIPHADKWEIVFNSNLDNWGLDIDPLKDILKAEVPVQVQSPGLEDFTILFKNSSTGANLLMAWGNVKVLLPITLSK